jgi:hypothetical protein
MSSRAQAEWERYMQNRKNIPQDRKQANQANLRWFLRSATALVNNDPNKDGIISVAQQALNELEQE